MTGDVLRSYNRDTAWVATGVLGAVFLAALLLAVQERQSKATLAASELLPSVNSATMAKVIAPSSSSDDKVTSGPGSSFDHTFTGPSDKTIPYFTPEKSRNAQRQDSARVEPKSRNVRNRSSLASRFIGVKRRLVELWHKTLVDGETRSWTAFSKLNSGVKKKAAYTAATRD
jgi:hypothetical protein